LNQRWVFTPEGFIASAANHSLVLDVSDNDGKGSEVILYHKKAKDNRNQLWNIDPSTGTISSRAVRFASLRF
jgi:hypothetical protein